MNSEHRRTPSCLEIVESQLSNVFSAMILPSEQSLVHKEGGNPCSLQLAANKIPYSVSIHFDVEDVANLKII